MIPSSSTKKRGNTRLNIIFYMMFPAILAVILVVLVSSFNLYKKEDQVRSNCSTSLQLFSQRSENEIMGIIRSSDTLSGNANFSAVLDGTADFNNISLLYDVKNTILSFTKSHPIINDIIVIDQDDRFVVSSTGKHSFDKYFDHLFTYSNYDKEYWKAYKAFDSSPYRILPPSSYTAQDFTDSVIPIVIRGSGSNVYENLLVINISVKELISLQGHFLPTADTEVFLMNDHTGNLFYLSNETIHQKNILDTDLYKSLLDKNSFKFNIEGIGNSLIITQHSSDNLKGYTYFLAIPYSSIHNTDLSQIIFTLIIFILFAFITISVSISGTDKILKPIKKAIRTIDPQQNHTDNVFENLEHAVKKIHNINSQLSSTLPYAQEKYLINYLNSADFTRNDEAQEIIHATLPFRYNYFASVILQTYPTKLFFETYSQEEYANIQAGLHTVIKQIFSEKFLSFFLTSDKDVVYIIINSEFDGRTAEIDRIIAEISSLLEQDNGFINVYAGTGGMYEGWEGLKKSHLEAISNLKYLHQTTPKIVVGQSESLSNAKISQLYNALITFNIDSARDLINEFCADAAMDQRWLKQLYTQILTTIFSAMNTRNISYNDSHLDFEVYANILTKSCADIYKEINSLLNTIEAAKDPDPKGRLGTDIIDYINENFTESTLSLDQLAEHFKVQPTYISTLVKNTLGIGFHAHLTALRISKAKDLLTTSNMSIQEVYEACGFCSKPTFFRVFKKDTGVAPSEYRKSQSDILTK